MRIAVGGILQESNPFAPQRATMVDFRKNYFVEGDDIITKLAQSRVEVTGAIDRLSAGGAVPVPLFATHGGAGGPVTRECFDDLLGRLIARLSAARDVDGVLLATHGAMVVDGTDDAESEMLEKVRAVVGERTPIAVTCDLHANVTPTMIGLADIIVGYQTYPHMDTYETGERAAALLMRTVRGEIRPRMRVRKAPMQVPGVRQLTAGPYPMAEINARAREMERLERVLSVSYFAAFSKLDAPDTGWRALAITDNDAELADNLALELVRKAWSERQRFIVPTVTPDRAITEGMTSDGLVVLVDSSDVVGGGAPGDSPVVLRALVEAGLPAPAATLVTDPDTVAQATAAGVGATLRVRVGSTYSSAWYGAPVELDVRVKRLSDGAFTYRGGIMRGANSTMGPTALLKAGSIEIVCCSLPTYEYADEQYLAAGVDVSRLKFIVSKTAGNFSQGFPQAAAAFVLDTPGPTTPNQKALPWKHVDRPMYPLDDDFQPDFLSYPPPGTYRRGDARW